MQILLEDHFKQIEEFAISTLHAWYFRDCVSKKNSKVSFEDYISEDIKIHAKCWYDDLSTTGNVSLKVDVINFKNSPYTDGYDTCGKSYVLCKLNADPNMSDDNFLTTVETFAEKLGSSDWLHDIGKAGE